MEDLSKKSWWSFLDGVQQDLLRQSLILLEKEEKNPSGFLDYSFVVFPAARAYEGFLKKLFFDLGLINRSQFSGERFRIGRALNPAIYKEYPRESVYEKLTRFCGGEEISSKLWHTWKNSRNMVFHFFPEKDNLVNLVSAREKIEEILTAIDFSFKGCQVAKTSLSAQKRTLSLAFLDFFLVLVGWSVYRYFFRLPLFWEEAAIKPALWLLPTIYLIRKVEKRPLFSSLGYLGKNFQTSLWVIFYFLVFVVLESLIVGFSRHSRSFLTILGTLPLSSLVTISIQFLTAVVEETFFRGYLFNRLWEALGKAWKANLLVSLGFVLIHLPISIFVLRLSGEQILAALGLLSVMSFGSGLLFSLTYNTVPSIVWHFLWNWQVILGL
ncbi:MAG: CAAX amino terminal protease self- immunity [Microgenomates group bacterium ADurb.Bin219]|nr:MAG: CAAX amino terminal protease self- immunity [Microgenomates group bacterium ADurb.Bin219]HNP89040.1 CPBP family glutamic-type intramembrane protease [Candidatus Woesebacteria bacterium]